MMSESKLFKSIVIGALTGAIISMFDRKTREHTIEMSKKVKDTVIYYAKNKDELQHIIEEKLDEGQELYDNASENINTIVHKIEEVKELPNTIQNIVSDTKNAFTNNVIEK